MGHIYKITHTATGRFYIGMTTRSINERFYHHVYVANSGRSSHFLANAIRKYGRDAFELETVEFVRDDKDLPDREIFWIAKLRPTFNMTAGGEVSPMLNPIVSKKNGDARRGLFRSDETKAKMSAHVKTKEHRANLSAAL